MQWEITVETQWKLFEGCKIIAWLSYSKLGELLQTNKCTSTGRCLSNIKELSQIIIQIQILFHSMPNPELFGSENF